MAERNVRVTMELDLAWPDPLGFKEIGPSVTCDDETHDAIAETVHRIIARGDPGDEYDMTVVVENSRPIEKPDPSEGATVGRDHSCERCGRGGLNDSVAACVCLADVPREVVGAIARTRRARVSAGASRDCAEADRAYAMAAWLAIRSQARSGRRMSSPASSGFPMREESCRRFLRACLFAVLALMVSFAAGLVILALLAVAGG